MNVFILGATGGIGSALVEQALEHGHTVTAFVRSPEKITQSQPNLRIQQGDPRQTDPLAASMAGHDAVLSALGVRSLGKRTLLEDCVRSTVEAMRRSGVRRLLIVSAALLFPDAGPLAPPLRFILHYNIVDSKAMEQVVAASDLDWTIARPPRLTDGKHTGRFRVEVGRLPKNGFSISRADVAHFLLRAAEERTYVRAVAGVCY
ncbi:MAG TPA: SDR family oxidoreductase [Chthoniobacterales bacterium]|nr:SDR family oxidoreductase [Chthoniobacterales bacterium]